MQRKANERAKSSSQNHLPPTFARMRCILQTLSPQWPKCPFSPVFRLVFSAEFRYDDMEKERIWRKCIVRTAIKNYIKG